MIYPLPPSLETRRIDQQCQSASYPGRRTHRRWQLTSDRLASGCRRWRRNTF